MLAYGPWRPDVGGPNSGFATTADSVLPQAAASGIGYGPFPQFVTAGGATALSGAPRGSISLVKFDGTWQVYFGTVSTIEQLSASYGFTSISTGHACTAGDDWSFLHFGSYLLNTNTTDGFRAYNVETPAGNNTVSGAPSARSLFSCNNVVFALDCDGNNRRIQSSGIGDHTTWNTKGANGKTFEDGGALICGVDLKNGSAVVFQDAAMRLIQFGGAPGGALYSITKVADGRGAVSERSVVSFDGMVFYLASDGFYKFTLGGNEPIGAEKVNRWFLEQVSVADLPNVQGAVDPKNKIVAWRISSTQLLCYDWQLNEWFTATASTTALSRVATPGYTIDDIDSFGVLDSLVIPFDDRFWQGGQPVFAGLDVDYKYATFSGTPMAATLETCVMNSGTNDIMNRATPIDDSPDGTLQIGTSANLTVDLTWKAGVARQSGSGTVPLRARGNNIAFRRNITAGSDWTFANGVEHLEAAKGGRR